MDIIVVEGTHDEVKIKSVYPNANCIITNGSEISNETLDMIKKLSVDNNIIIFTDPDYPGERIRNKVASVIKNPMHAFLKKEDCISNNHKKVGIEHASKEAIVNALANIYKESDMKSYITVNDLYSLGLIGSNDSKILRDKLSNYLNIGMPNGKTLLKRLNILGLNKNEVSDVLCKLK